MNYCPDAHAHQIGVHIIEDPNSPVPGHYIHHQRLIVLRSGLAPIRRRCILAHELVHAEAGHEYAGPLQPHIEAWTDLQAAQLLINPHLLHDLAKWALSVEELCVELRVSPRYLHIYNTQIGLLPRDQNQRLNPILTPTLLQRQTGITLTP